MMQYEHKEYETKFKQMQRQELITYSNQQLKIQLFHKKAESSFLIACHHQNPTTEPERVYWWQWAITIAYYSMLYGAKAALLTKGYEVKTHMAAQVALGYLFVPTELQKEDLEILHKTHTMLEEEHVQHFNDTRTESNTARYAARSSYTKQRVTEILSNAKTFIKKIDNIIE